MNLKQLQDKAEKEFNDMFGRFYINETGSEVDKEGLQIIGSEDIKQFLLAKMKEAAEEVVPTTKDLDVFFTEERLRSGYPNHFPNYFRTGWNWCIDKIIKNINS